MAGTCPNCGYCDKCGRGTYHPWPQPVWPRPYGPYWQYPAPSWGTGINTISNTSGTNWQVSS